MSRFPVTVFTGDGPTGETSPLYVRGPVKWTVAGSTLTRPNNSTAYAAHKSIGSSSSCLFTFSSFFEKNGAHALLTGMRVMVSKSGGISVPSGIVVRAHLYDSDPTATVLSSNADQADFKVMAAVGANKLGVVDFSSWTSGGSGSDAYESYGVPAISPMHIRAASAADDLYAVLEATAAFTPTAQSVWTLYASRAGL